MNILFSSQYIGIRIGSGPTVIGVTVGGSAEGAGVILDMPILSIGEHRVVGWSAQKCVDLVRSLPRPITVVFGRGKECMVSRRWLPKRVERL